MAATQPKSSPARLAANRANAQKSTGPKTEEGKARSRANALKHGLTGAGIALPGEDAAAIEATFLQAHEEFAPTTLAGMRLVRDVAMLWVRQDRARQYEATALAAHARHAERDFDQARVNRAEALIDAIEANPRAYRRALLAMPEGVDRLVAELLLLLEDLTGPAPSWSATHHQRLDALFGFRVADLPWSRPTRFSKAILGDFAAIGEAEVADIPLEDQQGWAMTRLVEAIGAEVVRLREHRVTIDLAPLAEDRVEAVALASLDPGKEGALAQRYLAAAARDLSRALRDLHLVETRYGTDPEPEPIADPHPEITPDPAPESTADPVSVEPVTSPLASFGEPAPPAAPAACAMPRETPVPALGPIHTVEPALFYPAIRQ